MAHMVFCVRNKKEMEGLDEPPFDSEFGQKIYKNVSKAAWDEWLGRQKMLLNEYRLQPWLPQAQQFLVEQMEEFFFGSGSALPADYVPPRTNLRSSRWSTIVAGRPAVVGHHQARHVHRLKVRKRQAGQAREIRIVPARVGRPDQPAAVSVVGQDDSIIPERR